MANVRGVTVSVADEDHESITLNDGDEVPSWAEKLIEDQYLDKDGPKAAGTNLVTDNIYQTVKMAADDRGVEYGEDWSAEQIAAAVRNQDHHDFVAENTTVYSDDEGSLSKEADEVVKDSHKAMQDLFKTTNEAGNVNAPDVEKKSSRRGSSASGSTGGSDS